MQKIFLGIDGGGTKTDAVAVNEAGEEVGTGSSGPTNLTSTSLGAAGFNLKEAIRQALENIEGEKTVVAAMGLAGIDTQQEHDLAYQAFLDIVVPYGINRFHLVHDSEIALENGTTNANAVVLIAGTGSICVGRNQQGATAKTGGMDYLLTDQGSGYDIGRHVLREAVKSFDGRREKTQLEQLVCQFYDLPDLSTIKLKVYNPLLNKVEIAEFSKLCMQAYEAGDQGAQEIFQWAVREQEVLVSTVLRRLQLETVPTDIVLTGSIATLPHISELLKTKLNESFAQLAFVIPERPAVYGAVSLARSLT
ncbi:MAG: BadF/BadG/BcrA/BcrD ATPase family protein [Patescibacteria group bacterium]